MLQRPSGLGPVFARHAYGMRRWVELFARRIPGIENPETASLAARVVGDNVRHMVLFEERARAAGVDPHAYVPPPEGEASYEPIPRLPADQLPAYTLGSLEHFSELLAVYGELAEEADAEVIAAVRSDNERAIASLRAMVGEKGERAKADAHERYRRRELAETPLYASGS